MMANTAAYWRRNEKRMSSYGKIKGGKIGSYSIVHDNPSAGPADLPYITAIIELEDGSRVFSQIVPEDIGKLGIGKQVVQCTRRTRVNDDDGLIEYGTKFRIVNSG